MCFYKCPSCEAEMNQHDKPTHTCPDTTNDFTTAARAKAATNYDVDWDAPAYYDEDGRRDAAHFLSGAEWARDHLAAQEPTDAEVRKAKAEALRNLPPHLSLKISQCAAREGGGEYCSLELGHSGDHQILDVPDGWILGAVDRYINSIETGASDEHR